MLDFLNALSRTLSPLWEMSLTAAYAAAVVILLRLFLKKRAPKQVLCLLWLVVFARLLIPVSLESPLSIVPDSLPGQELQGHLAEHDPVTPEAGAPATPVAPQAPTQGQTQNQPMGGTVIPANTAADPILTIPDSVTPVTPPSSEASAFPWQAVIAGVWLVGAAAMCLYALSSYFRLRRRLYDAIRAKDGAWEHPDVDSPFILGMFRPRIYLPAGLVGQPRKFILCHERAHLRRLDHIVKPVCWIALALHWFNPLVWAAFILMSRDIEAACDEAVVRQLGSQVKADYSTTLLALATGRHAPAPCPLAFDEGDAKGRIQNVLNYRRPALWVIIVSAVAAALAAVCLLTDPVAATPPDDGGPEPDATASQALENSLADTLLDPWMKEILDGERTFRSSYNEEQDFTIHQMSALLYGEPVNMTVKPGKLAILDMDRDGINEMVIYPVQEPSDSGEIVYAVGYLILHRQGDEVYGYAPGWRSCVIIREDGTFSWSSGVADHGTAFMSFDGNQLVRNDITWCASTDDPSVNLYFVDGLKATREEFDAAYDAHTAKAEPMWYTYENGVLAPWSPFSGLELLGQTDPDTNTGEAKLWLDRAGQTWLEWHGATTMLNSPIPREQFVNILCRDFEGDGQDEVVITRFVNGFAQLDLYEWVWNQPGLTASYDTQQLLVRFNQNNVAGYNKDSRGLTVTYFHTEGHMDDEDFYRHYVSGSCTLPEDFFNGYEHIRDSYTHAYAYQFHLFYPNQLDNGTTEFYFDFEFCLADETMQELDYVDVPPESELSPFSEYYIDHHYMAERPVGVAHFDLYYDGTAWQLREGDQLAMDGEQTNPIDDIYTAAPLSAPIVGPNDIPDDPNEWYKVAELPDDMIWLFSRNYGSEVLIRWDGNFFQPFDHIAHTPRRVLPRLKEIGTDPNQYGPLAVISNVDSGTGTSVDELVVYDLDAAPAAMDYVHDWKPLRDDFNDNVSYQYDNDAHAVTYTYQGQTMSVEIDGSPEMFRRIEQEGIELRLTGDLVYYEFQEDSSDITIQFPVQLFIGSDVVNAPLLFPEFVTWTIRFNGSGFTTVPGSCDLLSYVDR